MDWSAVYDITNEIQKMLKIKLQDEESNAMYQKFVDEHKRIFDPPRSRPPMQEDFLADSVKSKPPESMP